MSISLPNYTKNTLMILFFFIVVSCNEKVDKTDKYIIDRFEKQFYTGNGTGTSTENLRMVVDNEGKIGVGTFIPRSTLIWEDDSWEI